MKQEFKLTQDNLDKLKQELEYLRSTARDYQADMNIYFHDDSAGCAAQVARSYHARIIFTGMAAEPINGFIDRLRRLLPQTPIAMVDKQGTVYRMDPHQVAHTR